ncbi:MAG TPA: cupin domain-containing protein [Egibacteraceae bacterium]|nr:cupin domain-containing protein [Egibacteraceae bacterium]
MTIADPPVSSPSRRWPRRELNEALRASHTQAMWCIEPRILPYEPAPRAWAWRWDWQTIAQLARDSAEVGPAREDGGHRVVGCANPGLRRGYGQAVCGATQTLWAGIEYLAPHESSRAHRHSPTAIRFAVLPGTIWTTVNGERCLMAAGDVIVTPAWAWHDTTNGSDDPALWLNVVDLPLQAYLDAQFVEDHPLTPRQSVLDTHASQRAWSTPGLAPQHLPSAVEAGWRGGPDGVVAGPRTAALRYPWPRTLEALELLRGDGHDPWDGVLLHYTDPLSGGAVSPTMGVAMQLLPAGFASLPHRHVHSAVYQVFEGSGFSVIDGVRMDWRQGDVFALPPWALHEHHAPHGDATLFSVTDRPAVSALGLERVAERRERQDVRSSFTGEG